MFDDSDNELEKSYRPPPKPAQLKNESKPAQTKVDAKKKSNFDDSDDDEIEFKPPPTRETQPVKKAPAKAVLDSDEDDDF